MNTAKNHKQTHLLLPNTTDAKTECGQRQPTEKCILKNFLADCNSKNLYWGQIDWEPDGNHDLSKPKNYIISKFEKTMIFEKVKLLSHFCKAKMVDISIWSSNESTFCFNKKVSQGGSVF